MATQTYFDESRESDDFALPDLEIFQHPTDYDLGADYDSGWYYWACFPGCLPDSDPCGPFESEADAESDARDY